MKNCKACLRSQYTLVAEELIGHGCQQKTMFSSDLIMCLAVWVGLILTFFIVHHRTSLRLCKQMWKKIKLGLKRKNALLKMYL